MFLINAPALGAKLTRLSAAAVVLASAFAAVTPVAAQDAAAAAVAFPPAQVRAGSMAYAESCATCHGDRLDGQQDAPRLTGAEFQSHFWDMELSGLYDYISLYMPQDRPNSLAPEQYAAITAFVLSKNGIAATEGAEPMPGDSAALEAIMLPAAVTE